MDKIPIPDEDIVPMETIAPGVAGLRVMIVNVYAISRSTGHWILVDTGLPFSTARIRNWTEEHFGIGGRPSAILLTHGHFDHTGALEDLTREWDVPVYAHQFEMPYVTGRSNYPPPDPTVGGGLMALMAKMYPRGPVNAGSAVLPLPADGSVPGFPEWRWIHTPGHTVGHVSLFRDEDRCLVAGDAFVTTKQESFLAVATQRAELHGPPSYFTTDWDAARESVRRLAALRPEIVATGHGKALAGHDVPDAVAALAEDFDRVAIPEHGRYVNDSAA